MAINVSSRSAADKAASRIAEDLDTIRRKIVTERNHCAANAVNSAWLTSRASLAKQWAENIAFERAKDAENIGEAVRYAMRMEADAGQDLTDISAALEAVSEAAWGVIPVDRDGYVLDRKRDGVRQYSPEETAGLRTAMDALLALIT